MFFIPTAIFIGSEITWAQFIINNLIPATLGNIVGGALLVAGVYWYLFAKGKDHGQSTRRGRGKNVIFKDFERRLN
jgi:formate/nitrite transporter FocA (FNT family)